MKRLLLSLAFLTPSLLWAQEKFFLYGELGGGNGTHDAIKVGLNSVFLGNNVLSAVYYYHNADAKNIPSDFRPGFTIMGNGRPGVVLEVYGIMYGKRLKTTVNWARVIVKGGLCIGTFTGPENFAPDQSQGSGGILSFPHSNYKFDYVEKKLTGALVNVGLEISITRGWGFYLGANSNLNVHSPLLAWETSMIFGKVRPKAIKQKKSL